MRSTSCKGWLSPAILALALAAGCAQSAPVAPSTSDWPHADVTVTPSSWPVASVPPLDPALEARVESLLSKMTLEQKVGQIIQGDSEFVTPEDVKRYRLGSVLSGGNSAPGELPFAKAEDWLAAADAYWAASVDPEGVEVAIPVLWGIDAVHGHANMLGATIFPHNIGLGAANDPDLIGAIAQVTAQELIVSGHDWTFAPTVAVPQDVRWGRSYEGFSEDPARVAAYSGAIVKGLQGQAGTPGWLGPGRVISSTKHFLADGGTKDGRDQGDAQISEAELRDVHAAGYVPALEAGAQTVMASFSSWNGIKIHGSRALLTDILKSRMGFQGFVIGDWNAHGQIPGCTNTDCPQALLAGVDMYMAPDSWKVLYESTLVHVQSGVIPMARLDDAVRRILRVKLSYGLMEKGPPSAREGAGDLSRVASSESRALARRAVRQSLVLLKNEGNLLPLSAGPGQVIRVVGDGADSVSKASGGWTLSWQGGETAPGLFPNAQSILDGLREAVAARGGTLVFDPEGTGVQTGDIVIAVYGEDPYAEFRGDLSHLDFSPSGFDTTRLEEFRMAGAKVVSVFLSGRPLWVNPEINQSDAFVAAWLPGSEGGGVADLLLRTDPAFDFTGRLSFAWPASAVPFARPDEAPLFPLGYGLSYGTPSAPVSALSEESGVTPDMLAAREAVFVRGEAASPWTVRVEGGATLSRSDHLAQEDALQLTFGAPDGRLVIATSGAPLDWSRESNAAMELALAVRTDAKDAAAFTLSVGDCDADACTPVTVRAQPGHWQDVRVALSCFAAQGVDMVYVNRAVTVTALPGTEISFANIRLVQDDDGKPDCGG